MTIIPSHTFVITVQCTTTKQDQTHHKLNAYFTTTLPHSATDTCKCRKLITHQMKSDSCIYNNYLLLSTGEPIHVLCNYVGMYSEHFQPYRAYIKMMTIGK